MKDLSKEDMQELINLYLTERDMFIWLITIEEFYEHYIRRCECCGELILLEERDVELHKRKTWRGDIISCCEDCCEEIDSYSVEDDNLYDEDAYLYID